MRRLLVFTLLVSGCVQGPEAGETFVPAGGGPTAGTGPTGQGGRPGETGATGNPGASGETGETGAAPSARLVVPDAVHFGYRKDGASFSTPFEAQTLRLENQGTLATEALTLSIESGDTWASVSTTTVGVLQPGQGAEITVTPTIAANQGERILRAMFRIRGGSIDVAVPAYAAIGASTLKDAIPFTDDKWAHRAVAPLPRAPHPAVQDVKAHVHMSLPRDFRSEARTVDVLIALHGWGGIVANTLPAHQYVEQAAYSHRNAILIVPQGLYDTSADDFGTLRQQDGVKKLIEEVMIVLYRDGSLVHPNLGKVVISSHSGAYYSLSAMSTKSGVPGGLAGIILMDSMYGEEAAYKAYALSQAGRFVTNYQGNSDGPTVKSKAMAPQLVSAGLQVVTLDARPYPEAIATHDNVFHDTVNVHGYTPEYQYNLGEYWRNSLLEPSRTPVPELRTVNLSLGTVHATFYAEPSAVPTTYRVYGSTDGQTFALLGEGDGGSSIIRAVDVQAPQAGYFIRLTAQRPDLGESLPSDTYFVRQGTGAAKVVVVDAFDRYLDGKMNDEHHDYAARLGSDVDMSMSVVSCSDEAVETGGCTFTGADTVIWMAGLNSTKNPPITSAGETPLNAFLESGGRLITTGAEVGFALDGDSFLSSKLKVAYTNGDDANSNSAVGFGALANVANFNFGGVDSYAVDFPDIFPPASGATTVLKYGTGTSAAVLFKGAFKAGAPAGAVLSVGFPLETITPASARTDVVRALISSVR
jgi:hypothetical protein